MPVGGDFIEVAVDPAERRRTRPQERLDQFRQMVRIPDVILIEQGNEIARRVYRAEIAGRGLAAVGLAQQRDRIFRSEPANNLRTVIGRAIVDDDDLIGRKRLPHDAAQSSLDIRRTIIQGNDRRYSGVPIRNSAVPTIQPERGIRVVPCGGKVVFDQEDAHRGILLLPAIAMVSGSHEFRHRHSPYSRLYHGNERNKEEFLLNYWTSNKGSTRTRYSKICPDQTEFKYPR